MDSSNFEIMCKYLTSFAYCIQFSPIVWNHPSVFHRNWWKSRFISSECPMQFSKDLSPPPCTISQSTTDSVQSQSVRSWGVLSSVVDPKDKQFVAFVSNTFSCKLSLCINCNFKTKWQSCQPISHLEFLNSLFGCLVVGCLWGRYRGTQECHKVASPKSSVVFGRTEELSKGHMGIGWDWPRKGKTVPLSESWGETGFSHRRESG